MLENNSKEEAMRQIISLSSTFKFLLHLSTLPNNSSLDFFVLLKCDTLQKCIISALARTQTISAHMVVYASNILGCTRWREVISPLGSAWSQGQGVTAAFSLLS